MYIEFNHLFILDTSDPLNMCNVNLYVVIDDNVSAVGCKAKRSNVKSTPFLRFFYVNERIEVFSYQTIG